MTSGQMSDALANIGDLAAIYPDSQAQPAAPEQGTAPGCGPAEPQVGCCKSVPKGCEGNVLHPKHLSAAHASGRLPGVKVLNAKVQVHECQAMQGLGQILKSWAPVNTSVPYTSKLHCQSKQQEQAACTV